MHVAPQLSVGTTYKQDAVQPRGVSMIMSSDSAAAVPYGMVPQFSTLQIGSPVMKAISLAIMTMIQHKFLLFSFIKSSTSALPIHTIRHQSFTQCQWAIPSKWATLHHQMRLILNISMRQNKFRMLFLAASIKKLKISLKFTFERHQQQQREVVSLCSYFTFFWLIIQHKFSITSFKMKNLLKRWEKEKKIKWKTFTVHTNTHIHIYLKDKMKKKTKNEKNWKCENK